MELNTAKKFMSKSVRNRNLIESSIMKFLDARKEYDEDVLKEELENLRYFNAKIARAIKTCAKIFNEKKCL